MRWDERHTARSDNDEDHMPARIEQVSHAAAESVSMASVEMPTADEDFHGDGIVNSDVGIVWPDRELRHG